MSERALLRLERDVDLFSTRQARCIGFDPAPRPAAVQPGTGRLGGRVCRRPLIIGIQKRDELSLCMPETQVAGCRWPLVLLMQVTADARQTPRHLSRIVRRTIVNHDDLQRIVALAVNARYRMREEKTRH